MILILNSDEQVTAVLTNNSSPNSCPYYNDSLKQFTEIGASTYEFYCPSNHDAVQSIIEGGFVVRKDLDGNLRMFQIIQVTDTHGALSDSSKYVYAEDAGLELIDDCIRPVTYTNYTVDQLLDALLLGQRWQRGNTDYLGFNTFAFSSFETILAGLQASATQVGGELQFRVEMINGKVVGRYVDLIKQTGTVTNKRFTYDKDIQSIKRTIDMTTVATALIGVGNNNLDFKSLSYTKATNGFNKPANQDWVGDDDALQKYGRKGKHITKQFQVDTDDPNVLLQKTYAQLQIVKEPSVTYELQVSLLERLAGYEHEKVRIGDTVYVIDHEFNPALLLSARVMELDTCFSNPSQDQCVLGNYKLVNSNISADIRAIQTTLLQKQSTWDSASSDASTALSTANTAQSTANTAQSTANSAQSNATTALSTLTDIASDNKFSPSEKQATTKEWNIITSEKTTIDAQASTYSTITTEKTNYDNAYTTLSNYITPLLTNLTTTSDIVGTDFRSNFKAYYDARTTLLKKISDTAKSLADSAQTTANSKAKTFTSQPVPPYSVGDIWTQGSTGDVMNCATARASGSYTASDWVKSSKYTDDTTANSKAKTFIATPTVPYSLGDIYKNGQTTYICTTARATGSYTTTDWTLTGDVTANNTSADTSKVNGTASSTIVTYATNGNSAYNDTTGWKVAGKTTIDGANIETGTIIWDKAKGGTLTLGGASNGNGQLVLFDANGNQIANLDSSTGGFSNLYVANLDSPTVPSYSNQDISLYVAANADSVNGISTPDDNNLGNGWASPLQTISEAVRRIPKVYDGNVTIWLAYGQTFYEAGIQISGFSGSGTITIDGQYKTGTKLNGSIIVSNCSLWTVIKNFTINSNSTDYGVKYDGMSRGQVNTMLINGKASNGTTYGFVAFNGAYAEAISSEFYSCQRAVGGSYGGQAFIQNCKGYGSVAGVTSWAGHVHGTGTAPSGVATTNTAYGGAITASFTFDAGAYTAPTPPPTVSTWTSSASDSFTDGAMVWDNTTNDPLQGKYGSAGNYRGLWFFGTAPSTAVTGKTIQQIRVYLTRQNNSGSSGSVNAVIRPHGYTSVPAGQPAYLSASYTVGFQWGEGKWVNLPSSFYSLFSGGSAKGIMIYTTNTADYMRFSGYAKLEITYS